MYIFYSLNVRRIKIKLIITPLQIFIVCRCQGSIIKWIPNNHVVYCKSFIFADKNYYKKVNNYPVCVIQYVMVHIACMGLYWVNNNVWIHLPYFFLSHYCYTLVMKKYYVLYCILYTFPYLRNLSMNVAAMILK
jgi:hypothetical protein